MSDETIFTEALALSDASKRRAYLERVCTNPEQKQRIEELLVAVEGSNALDRPPVELAVTGVHITQRQTEEPSSFAGDRIGPYKLLEKIGEGGMGEVWVADQQEPIKRRVALKLIKPGMDSRSVLGRFEAERQALAVMDHPNIAKVLDAGTTLDGRPYFVMELVKGTPITEFADARKLTPRQRLELFIPVCQAIQHAHMKGIIHRDIKPSNVLVALHDEVPVPKVIDFGVAKAVGQQLTEKTIYTGFGSLVGTPAYMAPEQATFNQLDVDTRADVYALGVLLYELLAGSPPIEKDRLKKAALDEVLRIVREEEPQRPSQRLSTDNTRASIAAVRGSEPSQLSALMKGEIDWIVMKALEKDRNRRYESANGFAADVQRYLEGEPVQAVPPSLGYRLKKMYRRNKAAFLTGSAFTGVVVGAFVMGTILAIRATNAEAEAKKNETDALKAESEANKERDKTADANAELQRVAHVQRKTRYAAEMNLLQAAYNAKDMESVKKLLLAQIPKPGEPDDRGPEWHFWDRKLNGHSQEFMIPVSTSPQSPNALKPTLSPDGLKVVDFALETMSKREGMTFIVTHQQLKGRVWDTTTGKLVCEKGWDIPESKGRHMSVSFQGGLIEILPSFVMGGKHILVQLGGRHADESFTKIEAWRRDVVWNLETNEITTLHAKDYPNPGRSLNIGYQSASYSDDLTIQALVGGIGDDRALVVTRIADKKELLRVPVDVDSRIAPAILSPDGKYLIASTGKMPQPREGALPKSRITLWKIETGPKPVWEHEKETNFRNAVMGLRYNGGQFVFAKDGKTVLEIGTSREGHMVDAYSLEDGKPLTSKSLTNPDQMLDLTATFQFAGRNDRFAIHPQTGLVAVPTIEGMTIGQPLPEGKKQSAFSKNFECIDGTPHALAFRPTGELVSLHTSRDGTKIRVWPKSNLTFEKPEERLKASFLHESAVMSRDQTRITTTLIDMQRESLEELGSIRMIAVDNTGAKLLEILGSQYHMPLTIAMGIEEPIQFSNDGRYLIFAMYTIPKKIDEKPVQGVSTLIIHDLDQKREVIKITQAPNLLYRQILLSPDSGYMLAVSIPNPKFNRGKEKKIIEQNSDEIVSAKLYEIPTGRLIKELDLSKTKSTMGFRASEQGWLAFNTLPVTEGGPFCYTTETGELKRIEPNSKVYLSPSLEIAPIEKAGRVLRVSRLKNGSCRVEVWDATKQGKPERPIFAFEENGEPSAFLSPDGKRLLVFREGKLASENMMVGTLYCTATGRALLTVGEVSVGMGPHFGLNQLGFWSADSQQFWVSIEPNGKLDGFDFRPRMEITP